MRVYERLKMKQLYDDIDMGHAYTSGYWIGVVTGCSSVVIVVVLAWMYLHT